MKEKRLLNYKEFGEGKPVIVLHGLFGMLDNWQTFALRLGQTHHVVTVDLRNHGRSFHNNNVSYSALAEDIIRLADSLDLERFSIIGHSMGGKTACQLAISHPKRVEKLIVVDILPVEYERGHEEVLTALNDLKPSKLTSRSEGQRQLIDLLDEDKTVAFFLLKSLKRLKTGGFKWRFNLSALTEGYDEIRSSITEGVYEGDVIFVAGEKSNYVTSDQWAPTLDYFPNAELAEVENAGHWVHSDNLEGLIEVVDQFLD